MIAILWSREDRDTVLRFHSLQRAQETFSTLRDLGEDADIGRLVECATAELPDFIQDRSLEPQEQS